MKVNADLSDIRIPLGNNGITLNIADNDGRHRGDLRVGRKTVLWMKGKTREAQALRIELTKLLELIEEHATTR